MTTWDDLQGLLVMSTGSREAEDILALCERMVAEERAACAEIAKMAAVDFLSPQYATNQPMSSFGERFACGQIEKAILARGEKP